MTAAEQDASPPRLRILWTTMGPFPQPLVGITVQGEFMDTERAELLESVAEFVTAGRKRHGDEVESTIRGSNVEDYVQIKADAVHWPKPKPGNICAPPAIVRWLVKALPAILPEWMPLEVVWMPQGTRDLHVQPSARKARTT